ncbi:MAG: zf-HC2 domain-containing protein [Armatimonadota bacterium]|nr:zf-HC2 domain-containing protein [Armatimonadota bacterium]
MNCDAVSQNLKALLDGELPRLQAWRVRRHLARCADCREAWTALQSFNAALRAADLFPPEAATPTSARPMRVSRRLALGALVTAALAAFLFVLPFGRQPKDMGAAVAAALARTNTWHLSGWKQIDGKRVPWDIWGRRKPFLFYERVGDTITVDDGTKRLRLFPPNPALNRPCGLVVRTASEPESLNWIGPSTENMVGLWDWRLGAGPVDPRPFRQTPWEVVFRRQYPAGISDGVDSNQIYTISKRTWLPTQYRLHYNTTTFHRDTELLTAAYGVTIPRTVSAPPPPAGAEIADFTRADSQALLLQVVSLDQDRKGSLLVRFQGCLGSLPLTPQSTFTLTGEVGEVRARRVRGGPETEYLPMSDEGFDYTAPNGDIVSWLVPLDLGLPATPTTLPTSVHLTLFATLNVQTKATDVLGLRGEPLHQRNYHALFQKHTACVLPLPKKATVMTVQASPAWPNSWGGATWGGSILLPEYWVARDRAIHLYMASDYLFGAWKQVAPDLVKQGVVKKTGEINPALMTTRLSRRMDFLYEQHRDVFQRAQQKQRRGAAYWMARAVALIPNMGDRYSYFLRRAPMLTLADYQEAAGELAASKETLRRLEQEQHE